MSDDSFIQDVRQNPDDDGIRSIYADWLEERGDPRANYLRLELQLLSLQQQMVEAQERLDVDWLTQVRRSHIDLNAPILPGHSAAGIRLGEPIDTVIAGPPYNDVENFTPTHFHYRLGCIDLWAEEDVITQIGVSFGYQGRLNGTISIGSSLSEMEADVGGIILGEIGSLAISNLDGFCFSVKGQTDSFTMIDVKPEMQIAWMFVHSETEMPEMDWE